jgi:hypothetical protein
LNDIKEHKSSKVAKGGHVKQWSAALQLMIVGFYVPLSLLIPTGFGFLLDRKASHEFPLYALIGLGVGTVIMVYGVYRMVRPFIRESKQQGKENQLGRPIMTTIGVLTGKRKKDKEEG